MLQQSPPAAKLHSNMEWKHLPGNKSGVTQTHTKAVPFLLKGVACKCAVLVAAGHWGSDTI